MKVSIIILLIISTNLFAQSTGRSNKGGLKPKKVTQVSTTTTEKEYYTAFLVADLQYSEPSGNKFLDANEEGQVSLSVKNIGKMPAENCVIQLTPDVNDPNISVSDLSVIDVLKPGEEKYFTIHIKALQGIKSGQTKFTLKIVEKNGFDLDPEKILIIPTREFQPPILEVVDYGIEDQSRDMKIEKFEKVDLTVRIQNRGETTSENTKAKIILGENIVPLDLPEEFDIGELKSGEYKDIKAVIVTNARATEVKLDVKVSEKSGKYSASKSLNLPFNVVQKNTDEIVIAQGEDKKTIAPEILLSKLDIADNIPQASEKKLNAVAVIIGNKDYEKAPDVDFALNDAAIVRNYVERSLGYQSENIIYIEDAKQSDLVGIFGNEQNYKGRLFDYTRKGLSEVFIYYSGHGAPDPESKQGFIVPVDCDPNRVSLNGYSISMLYQNIDKIAREKDLIQVTIVLDACFSGNSESGSLLTNISPVYISVDKQGLTYPNSSIFTSATGDQVSTWYREKKQGLFTYFFLKGLQGEADFNKDGTITTEELYQFTADEVNGVPYWSRRLNPGRTQTPSFYGNDYIIRN